MNDATRSLLRRLRAPVLAVVGLGTAFVGVVGFAHTPAGRPLLRYIPGMGTSCPVGMDAVMTAEARDRVRVQGMDGRRGEGAVASRRALAFSLDETSMDEVGAWAREHEVSCATPKRPGGELELSCVDVPAAALAGSRGADALLLRFDAQQRLIAVDASGRTADVDEAASFVHARAEQLTTSAGPPSATKGEATAAHLGRGALNQAAVEFDFADLSARVVATNMGHGAYVVREVYQSLRS